MVGVVELTRCLKKKTTKEARLCRIDHGVQKRLLIMEERISVLL